MALWVCQKCTTKYSVGAPRCPHCGSTEWEEDGAMPKITVHGGATNADVDTEQAAGAAEDTGGDDPSPGNSSERSSGTPSPSGEQNSPNDQPPARTTENPSTPGQTGSSTARSTGGARTGRPRSGSGS